MSFVLPDCMMPDGAEPCKGYRELKLALDISRASIREAARVILGVGADVLYQDPHQWSDRPCQTCRAVTDLLGAPFGCIRFSLEKGKTR